ncbi:probable peroxisomal acyl-coenzyme A oxidase 1 [Lucilia cuprina]|uniref:probable peroxisomal acyl-coenzyme A oxidase 1 n=1 Tax=Lucilia cuprina TaxID=7375 RepID=UPI001F05C0B6|nr:probable peroxisomal acyl-coenzyme A oxidase 1 [Lucilia cuprina]
MTVNNDLLKERQNATIKSEDFAVWWSCGKDELYKRRALEKLFFDDPQFDDPKDIMNYTHKQLYEYTTAKSTKVIQKLREWYGEEQKKQGVRTTSIEDMYLFRSLLSGPLGTGLFQQNFPLRLHFSMFLTALLGQSNEEQCREWLEKAWNMEGIIGTYAQTELGHGTYIRGLETRADYDIEKREFILNTPSLTAYKWWPGGLGHTANMVILMAQLYIKDKHYGLQPFLVRIRNEKTHQPEPGVDVGDVGPKLGVNGVNNGFLGLKNVRIPLKQMLSKHNQVLADGTFVKGPEPVMLYSTMSYVRVNIVKDVSFNLLQAAVIATRYSAIRRQGIESVAPKKEIQVLDFLTQQHKVFPQIAKGIFYRLAADYVWDLYRTVHKELEQGNKRNLSELHALSCCLKAVCSHEAAKGVETLRKSCGGHGYLNSANFMAIYGSATAACTYEGENTVLLLQTARFLVKYFEEGIRRKYLPKSVVYLRTSGQVKWSLNLETIVKILEYTSLERVKYVFLQQRSFTKAQPDRSAQKGANRAGLILTQTAIMHGKAFLARMSYEEINKQINKGKFNDSLKPVMQQLLHIFILELFLTSLDDILRFNRSITAKEIEQVERLYEDMLLAFRPNAVALVDGFEFHDRVLGSTLGCYDGRAYERLMEEARKCELNQEPVNQVFDTHLKQLLQAKL